VLCWRVHTTPHSSPYAQSSSPHGVQHPSLSKEQARPPFAGAGAGGDPCPPIRLRGGGWARSRETRKEMNDRWRREARAKAAERAQLPGRSDDRPAPAPPPVPERRDPAAGVVLLNAAGEPEPSPRAALLAALCARQQCSALDPSLYNMEAVGEDAGKYSSMSDYIEWTRHHKSTDEDVGIVAYVTKTPGVGGLLKVS